MHRIGKFQTSKLIAAVAVVVMMPVLILASTVAKAALTATVDRTSVTELDLVTLTIRLSHATATGSPDFGVLEKDFDLVRLSGPNRSSQIIIENGRQFTDSHVEWALNLRPKRTGELTIPSFTIAGERTDPITLNVQEANARTVNRMNQFVFFETSVDTTSTYVQGQVIYTVKLFYVDAISGDFPPPPTISDAVIETIENEKRYESIKDNRRFYVLEKRYAIYPQRSGELIIPRETFTGTRGRGGFFSDRERVSAVSKQHLIEIKPRPDRFPSSHWLPAQAVTLTESWSQTGAGERGPTFTVGEPVNRTLTVTAIGLSSSLLPPFAPLELDNAKTYQDPAETNDRRSPDGMIASLKTTVGIVPTKAGTLTVPEVRIPWWNTTTDRLEIATIPSQTFEVAPAPASSSTFVPPETPTVTGPAQQTPAPMVEGSESRIWQTIAAILAAIWAITLYQWWALRRRLDQ
ncbi:MAG: BatD family protein, partial [Pseudomonadales bacterium]